MNILTKFNFILSAMLIYSTAYAANAASANASVVTLNEHIHVLTIDEINDNTLDKIKDITNTAFKDTTEGCRGFIVKTPHGIIEFKKFKHVSTNKNFTAEKIANIKLHGNGCVKCLEKIGIFLDKKIGEPKYNTFHKGKNKSTK